MRKSGRLLPDFLSIYLLRDIDKVDEQMADITEQQEVAQQISDAISWPVGFGDDVDEVIGTKESGSLSESMGLAKSNARENHGAGLRGDAKSDMFLEAEVSFLHLDQSYHPLSRMSCQRS